MIVLHILSSLESGSGKGSYLIHKELLNLGVDSRVLVLFGKKSKELNIDVLINSPLKRIYFKFITIVDNFLAKFVFLNTKNETVDFYLGFFAIGFLNHPWCKEADIIHLHWINNFLSINQISNIEKPMIWTIRDMWPFTVGHNYYWDEETISKNKKQIFNLNYFFSKKFFKYKRRKFDNKSILFIGISKWISSKANESKILKNHKLKTILNFADNDNFYPSDKDYLHRRFNINKKRKILLIGAAHLDMKYKGLNKFIDSLFYLDPGLVQIVCFGNIEINSLKKMKPFSVINLGYINSKEELSRIYSSAHIFIATSILESFGKTIVESMLCGTPCVVFDNSGPAELVAHKITGFKSSNLSSKSLFDGIQWGLDLNNREYEIISKQCIEYARREFNPSLSTEKYLSCYRSLLKEKNKL